MPELEEKVVEPQKEEKQEVEKSDLENLDTKELVTIIKTTRSEAAANRVALKEAQKVLDEIKTKEEQLAEEDLKKKGEYETLISSKEALISELQKKANAFDEYSKSVIEEVKTSLGDDWDDSFATLPLSSLKKLMKKTAVVEKVEVDSANHSKKLELTSVSLTKDEERLAVERYPNVIKEKAFELFKGNKLKKLERLKDKEK